MKKNYYINTLLKTIRFLILGISVCLIVIAACLVTDGKISPASMILFIILGILLCMTIIIYFFKIMPSYYFYLGLCSSFNNGEIHRKFFEKIPDLFPGIGGSFERLDSLLKEQDTLKLSTRQAEFLALQNQINPHFLYNTLDSIRGDALAFGIQGIADTTEALSSFFRYTITDTQNLVTLQSELDNVSNYFSIQQYRFGEKLSMHVDIPDDGYNLLQAECPKLLLQPIVENAIFHGLEEKSEAGMIKILIEKADDDLLISVCDNGVGMAEEQLIEINRSLNRISASSHGEDKNAGIALKNICRRIKLLFGEQYGIHISSIIGIGTKVDITLPLTRPEHS